MLITTDDLQSTLNFDLTTPAGQTTATTLIKAATAWLSKAIGYPIEETSVTQYFDGSQQQLWLNTGAPVSNLALSTFNPYTSAYDSVDAGSIRPSVDNEVYCTLAFPCFYRGVKATYTTGWTADSLPDDLRQALIEMVGLKLQQVANFSSSTTSVDDSGNESTTTPVGALKRVQSDSYSVEYSSAQSDAYWKAKVAQLSRSIGDALPDGIMEVVRSYRRSFAI